MCIKIKICIFYDESILNLIYVTEKKLTLHVMEVLYRNF